LRRSEKAVQAASTAQVEHRLPCLERGDGGRVASPQPQVGTARNTCEFVGRVADAFRSALVPGYVNGSARGSTAASLAIVRTTAAAAVFGSAGDFPVACSHCLPYRFLIGGDHGISPVRLIHSSRNKRVKKAA
jgi:hypothetical protein